MDIDYFAHLERIAVEMDRTRVSPDAVIGYNVLADALFWSDEYPHDITGRIEQFDCVKLLLRYRTTLLLGSPDDLFRPYWERARELFPNWAGFSPARLIPSEELRSVYEHEEKRATRRLERFNKVCSSAHSNRPSPNARENKGENKGK